MLGSKAEAVESEGIYMTKAEFDFDEFDFDEFDAPVSARSCQGERENLLEGHKLSAAAYPLEKDGNKKNSLPLSSAPDDPARFSAPFPTSTSSPFLSRHNHPSQPPRRQSRRR
jgi:hypothetical protein